MSRRPATVIQADIARALRAVKQSGMKMAVEISPTGTIRIVPADHVVDANKMIEPNPWDAPA